MHMRKWCGPLLQQCSHTYSINYQEKYKYITEKLSVLRTEMDDLKREDGQSHLDIIHNDNVRQGSTKRKLLDQVFILLCNLVYRIQIITVGLYR